VILSLFGALIRVRRHLAIILAQNVKRFLSLTTLGDEQHQHTMANEKCQMKNGK
jgi:hypothetical protein